MATSQEITNNSSHETTTDTELNDSDSSYIDLPKWNNYTPYHKKISYERYVGLQEITKMIVDINSVDDQKWFTTSKEASLKIMMDGILNRNIQFISLVAVPGSGKTSVVHSLIYDILNLPYQNAIDTKNISILTGMSDTEWFKQLIDNLTLMDNRMLIPEMANHTENHCITHRSNFHKRITYILNNLELLNDHIFIIDEFHFADGMRMTIDNELKRLGVTKQRMKSHNIKIILISATPDVNISIMSRDLKHHRLVLLKTGPNYKGFEYFYNKNSIMHYDKNLDIGRLIKSKYTTPRYHYIRARTSCEKGKYRKEIKNMCQKLDFHFIEDDSGDGHNVYISFNDDNNEIKQRGKNKTIIQTYKEPNKHTLILIKDKYSASKRLKLTKYTGLICEKFAKRMNASSTCNGLIPRFWMYGDEPEYNNNEQPLFVCDKVAVKQYIELSKNNFDYTWVNFKGRNIDSTIHGLKEKKGTVYTRVSNIEPINVNYKINHTLFNTFESAKKFIVHTFGGPGPNDNNYQQNLNGFIETQHHGIETKKVYSVEEVNKFGSGVNSNHPWRLHPCYEDKNDKSTLKWVVVEYKK
jgi:hypothetical protein